MDSRDGREDPLELSQQGGATSVDLRGGRGDPWEPSQEGGGTNVE